MATNLAGQTTLVSLIAPTTVTTTAAVVYGTAIDCRNFIGQPAFIFALSGSAGTASTLVAKVQSSEIAAIKDARASGTTDIKLREGAATNLTVGAAFTPSLNCSVSQCLIRMKRTGTIAGSKFIKLEIQSNSTTVPDDVALVAATTLDPLTVPTAYDFVPFTFTSLVDLASATAYHFVLSGDYTVHGTNCVLLSATTIAAAGTISKYDAAWARVATQSANLYATGYNWTDEKAITLDATGTITAWSPSDGIDSLGNFVRGRLEATSGDGDTSYVGGIHVLAEREQGS